MLASVLAALPAAAQLPYVGLSTVGGQAFASEDLFFYGPAAGEEFGYAVATGDFNGDGIDDLATGIAFDDGFVGDPILGCGAVVVRYGKPGGRLDPALADDYLNQLASGSPDPAEQGEMFGAALAAGDFDSDGIDDLAVGIPQNRTGAPTAGAVQIHYGRAGGIELAGTHLLLQGVAGVPGSPQNGDHFGQALASGDFDGDGHDDLAVGAPFDDVGAVVDAGTVTIFHGGAGGLLPFSGYLLSQGEPQIADNPETDDNLGWTLTTGDFDGNGSDDLAIGVPGEDGLGAAQVIFGSQFGLLFVNNRIFRQSDLGLGSLGGNFSLALASGDFDADGYDDLAIGAPQADLLVSGTLRQEVGVLSVLYGSNGAAPNWF
ncbi:MAG: FG-GAP repeat protein, partial [Thermoanaerobaculia bacterium]